MVLVEQDNAKHGIILFYFCKGDDVRGYVANNTEYENSD